MYWLTNNTSIVKWKEENNQSEHRHKPKLNKIQCKNLSNREEDRKKYLWKGQGLKIVKYFKIFNRLSIVEWFTINKKQINKN